MSPTINRRTVMTSLALSAAGCASSSSVTPQPRSDTTRTFVLVPGAWHGAWCWSRVTSLLRAQGHQVFTVTQTGLGERSHLLSRSITIDTFIQDVVSVIEWEDLTNVVLVGHSFGGVTISGVADRIPNRLSRLIYLDALVLQDGESPFDSFAPEMVAARRKAAELATGGLGIPVPDPKDFGVTDPSDSAWVRAKCTPHPISTYESKLSLKHPVGNGLPLAYVAVRPLYANRANVRSMVRANPRWNYTEMDAGHDMMVTSPQPLVGRLIAISAST